MLVTSADLWTPAPGTVVSWDVQPGASPPRRVDLSLNQRNHLAAAVAGEPSVWMAAGFDVDGPVDVVALERSYREVVARHSALQVGAEVVDGAVRGTHHEASELRWTRRADVPMSTVAETRDHVRRELDAACWPLSYPAFWPAAISRPDRSTVVLGLDHLHVDAYSLAVLVDDLHAVYAGLVHQGRVPDLPETSCFVAGLADPPRRVPADDVRLGAWHDFLVRQDHRLPTFPLPLGVGPGERVAQRTEVSVLGDASVADRLGAHAHRHGGSTATAALAALAVAVADLGGPDTLPVLMPVHLRSTPAERRTVGWLTTTVPVELATHRDACATLAHAAGAVDAARAMAAVPLDQVLDSATKPLVRERTDVFMASYLDYRRLPGHEELLRRRAHHVSAPTLADDLQVWVSRTHEGLGVRVRTPATLTAAQVVARLLERWRTTIEEMASGRCADPLALTGAGRPVHPVGSP
ncbi:MAG: condensation domain-containing protein [Propionibacteriales bacterium]|nr:condensation domain-containing protein [Propionibacteriales bacterium]